MSRNSIPTKGRFKIDAGWSRKNRYRPKAGHFYPISAFFDGPDFCTIRRIGRLIVQHPPIIVPWSPQLEPASQKYLPWAIGFALLAAVLAVASRNMVVDLDLFHEMALFRQIIDEGQMPMQDAFAYTPTKTRVVHHEWATGAVLYFSSIVTGWGAGGIVALKYLLSFSLCLGCYLFAHRRGASLVVFAVLAPVALNLGGWMAFTNVRAQLFTLLFLVGLYFLLDLDQRGKRWWIWLWFPMLVAWANLHGGVVSGLGILGVYGLSRFYLAFLDSRSIATSIYQIRHLVGVAIGTAILINVNPYGWEYTSYLFGAVTMQRPMISEWAPIYRGGSLSAQLTILISIGILAFGILAQEKTDKATAPKFTFETVVLLLTAYLAIRHLRHGSLYAVTWICFVPPLIEKTRIGESIRLAWKSNAPRLAVVGLAAGIVMTGFAFNAKFWKLRIPTAPSAQLRGAPIYPVGAVEFLGDQKFRGNLFVPFASGAYVSWKLFPAVKVSIDSRYEVAFPTGLVEENVDFYRASGDWEATLKKYHTDAILVPRFNSVFHALEEKIGTDPRFGWTCVYRDDGFGLFFRKNNPHPNQMTDRSGQRVAEIFP